MRILYLFRATRSVDRLEFSSRVRSFAIEFLAPLARSLTIAVSEPVPPEFHVIPFRRDLAALVSLDGVEENARWPEPPLYFAGAYRAEAAWPVPNIRQWELGTRTPGIGLMTLFRQRRKLSREQFLGRWFDGHTPLTLELHPNRGYVRNRISGRFDRAGTAGNGATIEDWDGIVEEQYDPGEDLLKTARFFGGERHSTLLSMIRVYLDIKGFIDYPSIRTWLTYEYRIKE